MTTKAKSKFDTTPADIKECSDYPQGFYPNGEWAGFFCGESPEDREKVVIEWCKKEKGRTFNYVPRPKPEPRVGVVEKAKRKVRQVAPVVPITAARKRASTKTSGAKNAEPVSIEWSEEDIKDDAKMESVAKKSQDEAIAKLTKKKVVRRKKK